MARKEAGGYHELLGHFRRVRAYMQHFYVYGFYTREEFAHGSARSYDNERRRVEGWLGQHMGFRTTRAGRSAFISFDSRTVRRNPLYRALKSKSFTDLDITLHFLILDVLCDGEERGVQDILEGCEARLARASFPILYDEKTLRDKLNEYEALGLLTSRRVGKPKLYRMRPAQELSQLSPLLAFFSEAAPCGVVGSFMEDRLDETCEAFRMKHHYIARTFDSEILATLLNAMRSHREVTLTLVGRDGTKESQQTVTPLRILMSVQDGRTTLAAWCEEAGFGRYRLDRLGAVRPGRLAPNFEALRAELTEQSRHIWGASISSKAPQHIEFTIRVNPWEEHVRRRMYRERRCGTVEEMDGGLVRFSAELYDPAEAIPWIRTFTGRIVSFQCENEFVRRRFLTDLFFQAAEYVDKPEKEDPHALQ